MQGRLEKCESEIEADRWASGQMNGVTEGFCKFKTESPLDSG